MIEFYRKNLFKYDVVGYYSITDSTVDFCAVIEIDNNKYIYSRWSKKIPFGRKLDDSESIYDKKIEKIYDKLKNKNENNIELMIKLNIVKCTSNQS